ncbi:MAG: hypothetical protein Q9162_007048 [Coniocarpon cinnabarinum]
MDLPDKIKNGTISADKIVLLIAALEKNGTSFNANYKLMSALSKGTYTHSALEHQFRELKKAAQKLVADNPDVTAKDAPPTPSKKRKAPTTNEDSTSGPHVQPNSAKKAQKTKYDSQTTTNDGAPSAAAAKGSKKSTVDAPNSGTTQSETKVKDEEVDD